MDILEGFGSIAIISSPSRCSALSREVDIIASASVMFQAKTPTKLDLFSIHNGSDNHSRLHNLCDAQTE